MTTLDHTASGMKPTPIPTAPSAALAMTPSARLMRAPASRRPGALDGAWWPRSRDLAVELQALLETWGTGPDAPTRALVHPAHWPTIPSTMRFNGHVLKASSFLEQDVHKLILLSRTAGRWDLLTVPPETDESVAQRLMETAAQAVNLESATDLLVAEGLVASDVGAGWLTDQSGVRGANSRYGS